MRAATLVLTLMCLVACGPQEIVVGRIPPSDGGIRPPLGRPCSDADPCPPDELCERPSCTSSLGRCIRRPPVCPNDYAPTCGCNGVNYWNDCQRRQAGEKGATLGVCTDPVACSAMTACPDSNASCALLLLPGAACSSAPAGVCWGLPVTCPPGNGAWESCGAGPVCSGLCAAIRSGVAHRPVNSCP